MEKKERKKREGRKVVKRRRNEETVMRRGRENGIESVKKREAGEGKKFKKKKKH